MPATSMEQEQQQQQQPPPRSTKEGGDDVDAEDFFCADLFVNKATKTTLYRIDDLEQPVVASAASTTDHDLTGQVGGWVDAWAGVHACARQVVLRVPSQ